MIRKEEEDQGKIKSNIFFPFIKRRKGKKINNEEEERKGIVESLVSEGRLVRNIKGSKPEGLSLVHKFTFMLCSFNIFIFMSMCG